MRLQWTWSSLARIHRNARALKFSWCGYLHRSVIVASFVYPWHILRMEMNACHFVPLSSPSCSPCLEAFSCYLCWDAPTSYAKAPNNANYHRNTPKYSCRPHSSYTCPIGIYFYSKDAMANISPLLALTMHPNELKCTFKPLKMNLLTKVSSNANSAHEACHVF